MHSLPHYQHLNVPLSSSHSQDGCQTFRHHIHIQCRKKEEGAVPANPHSMPLHFFQKAKYLSWKSLGKFLLMSQWSELGHLPELFTNRWVRKQEVVSGFWVTTSLLSSNSASHLLVSVSEVRPSYLSFYWLEGVWPPVQALPFSSLKTWEWVRPGKGQQKGPFLLKFILFWKVTPLDAVLV